MDLGVRGCLGGTEMRRKEEEGEESFAKWIVLFYFDLVPTMRIISTGIP